MVGEGMPCSVDRDCQRPCVPQMGERTIDEIQKEGWDQVIMGLGEHEKASVLSDYSEKPL